MSPSRSNAQSHLDDLLGEAAARSRRYAAEISDRKVAPTESGLAGLARFDEPLPEGSSDPFETLRLLDESGSPGTVGSTGGRYFGFVNGGVLPVALASAWLTSAWDQNTALPVMSPVAAALSDVARRWLVEILGLPHGTEAAFVSGATMANTSALAVARDHLLARIGWDVQLSGLFGAPEVTVLIGERAHSTLGKALGLIGLGRERVCVVPADDQGRMRADLLPDVRGPAIVCAQAGEVNTGAFDPFPEIIAWARDREAWVHVDGAFGLWALSDPALEHEVVGLRDADSWATDGHKWLNVTYDSGIAFVRRGEDLRRTFASTAGYLPPDTGYEAMHHSPQSSQRARAVEIWAVLRSLGRTGVADLVASRCALARRVGSELSEAGLEVINRIVLNQVLVRASDDELTSAWINAIQQDGTCWCGPTKWQDRAAMRVSISGWATTDDDISVSVASMLDAARRVGALPDTDAAF